MQPILMKLTLQIASIRYLRHEGVLRYDQEWYPSTYE
jgi:hypothetical protein